MVGLHPSMKTFGSTSTLALPQGGAAGSMPTDSVFGVATIACERAQARQVLLKGGVVLSFPPSSFDNVYQHRTNMAPTSTRNGTSLAQGGGKGYPKINKKI